MLAASTASPNPEIKTTPKPQNWHGVSQGLAKAKQAFQNKEWKTAETILLEVLEFAPTEAKAWAWLGRIMELQNQHEKASDFFQKAESILRKQRGTTVEPASLPLAKILWQQGAKEDAKAMLNTLLLEKQDDEGLLTLSKLWESEQ
jgi:predicted Zn-dependent protease